MQEIAAMGIHPPGNTHCTHTDVSRAGCTECTTLSPIKNERSQIVWRAQIAFPVTWWIVRPDQTRLDHTWRPYSMQSDAIRSVPFRTRPAQAMNLAPSFPVMGVCLSVWLSVCVYVSGSNARTEPGLSCLIVCQSPHNMLSYMCVSLFDCVLCGCVLAVHNVRCLMSAVPCLLSTVASCCTAWQTTSASTLTPTPAPTQTLAKKY